MNQGKLSFVAPPLAKPAVQGWTLALALFCAFLLAFALNASVNTKPVMPPTVAKEHMEHWLIDRPWQVAGEAKLGDANLLQSFYYARDYQPVWLDGYELKPAARDLLAALRETAADDWRRYDYRVNTLLREASQLTNLPRQATAVDILLTDAFISYAREVFNRQLLPDMGEGDHPVKKVSQEFIEASQVGSDEVLNRLAISLQNRELESLVQQLTPQHQGYLALRQQLNLYFSIANSGHWKPMNQLAGLQQGQQHPDLAQLRWLLTKTGDISLSAWSFTQPTELLPPDHESSQWSDEFDDMLVAGIRRFQSRFGLKESGELTPETISWLNVPPYQIAQKIALNMKRWRHLPEDLGRRYVMVNMANYQLEYVEDDDVELEMKVIIGKLSRRTPVMVDTIRQMELAPTWGVPHRIAVQYLLPKFRRNPSYIHQKGFRIIQRIDGEDRFVNPDTIDWKQVSRRHFPYRIMQKAGTDNALGQVKFLFPNPQSIYLHDTSQPQLFALERRALSSGCVRVEKPLELAEKLLESQPGWSRRRVEETITQNRTTRLRLNRPVPVYLMYWTTWVDRDGRLQVREDVYKRDLIAGQSLPLHL